MCFCGDTDCPSCGVAQGTKEWTKVLVVDRWDGAKWIEVRLELVGTEYKEIR